jgi:hypothetical protein
VIKTWWRLGRGGSGCEALADERLQRAGPFPVCEYPWKARTAIDRAGVRDRWTRGRESRSQGGGSAGCGEGKDLLLARVRLAARAAVSNDARA